MNETSGTGSTPAPDAPAPTGLTTAEARRRLAQHGRNTVVGDAPHPVRSALAKLWAPVPWMLEAAIVLEVTLGQYVEAGVIASLLLFNATLGYMQERSARTTLDTLTTRLAPTASVRRDGEWSTVPAAGLVPGDLVTLSLGAVVPADVAITDGSVLIDSSALTGESVPEEAGPGGAAYAGALVRRGEAHATVTATGTSTRFGRGAELVRTAHVESAEQKAIFRIVRNIALFNGGITLLIVIFSVMSGMQVADLLALVLVAVLASVPVALPSMFTLAATVGAQELGHQGVLPTRLSALGEAAGVDVLCVDKTGTLTENSLAVAEVRTAPSTDAAHVLALAALASSLGGADPVDAAVRQAAEGHPVSDAPQLIDFTPFDPGRKLSSAKVRTPDGEVCTVSKGAFAVVSAGAEDSAWVGHSVDDLESSGHRVLAVSVTTGTRTGLVGLIALGDPPRGDSAALVRRLDELGVRTVMVTGDAPATASAIAGQVGIAGSVATEVPRTGGADVGGVGVFAGVLPEGKFDLVKLLQGEGHIVAMCGDGVNDAPALRQAQMGIAVSTATDAAKSAAGLVLTTPGLAGVVAAIEVGRSTFQRILSYTLRSIIHKTAQVLFLFAGLLITGGALITPVLMVIMMITGDFLAMSSSTDNVTSSARPSTWRIGRLTAAGVVLGLCDLVFCTASILTGHIVWGFDTHMIQSLAVVTLVFSGQAIFYVSRERRHLWSSRPSGWMVASSVVDVTLITVLATCGILMAPLPLAVVAGVAAAAVVLAFALDLVKVVLFRRLSIV